MKPQEIKDLIDYISKSDLSEVNIETDTFKINVKKGTVVQQVVAAPAPVAQPVQTVVASPIPASLPVTEPTLATAPTNQIIIKSPMIGTFYRAASPETPAFVNIGDEVHKGKVVCIVEAMKLFNEIESEVSGKVVKILVENATPVEFDQPLFILEPIS